ncbi:glycosyltransferase family 2 protein [uncultured Shewanella sp.]|uniref:glycosyltransferase family 2 protein n=1 Tax=uncultured Shewanella sp. TaxID=173975 RepID=UPI00261F21BA|nr:glycosyltransferase family 2 protein [uncultured Shewanella sp.]
MSSGLISVVIPFFSKVSGRLKQSVMSALQQQGVNVEVIVVDDCSPLSAASELEGLQDPRLRVIRHSKNSNGGIARNTGVDNANGKFIAFLDYDDVWYQDKLVKQLALHLKSLNQYAHPVIYSKCRIVEGEHSFIRPRRAICSNESVGDYLFIHKEIIQTSGIFLSRETASLVKFDDLKRHQDYQYCLALESVGAEFVLLEDIAYDFVQVPKLNDYTFSLYWLKQYRGFLSDRAINSFKVLVILRSMVANRHFAKAFKFTLENRIYRDFFKICLINFIKAAFPSGLVLLIKNRKDGK